MDQGKLFNLVGTMLIIFATALHMVCLVTPHFSEADHHISFKQREQHSSPETSENSSIASHTTTENEIAPQTITENKLNFFKNMSGDIDKINFGLWELCFLVTQLDEDADVCVKWSGETTVNSQTKNLDSIGCRGWMRAVQAMAILGILLAGGAITIALINVVFKSKGDRLRLIHIFIATGCFVAGGFLLLGNLIMAANFKDVIQNPEKESGSYPFITEMEKTFSDYSYLSWGFALDVVAFALAMLAGVAHLIGGKIIHVENGIV